jgi:hypothetical protein
VVSWLIQQILIRLRIGFSDEKFLEDHMNQRNRKICEKPIVAGVRHLFYPGRKEADDYDHLTWPLIVFRLAPDIYIWFNLAGKAEL